MAENEPGHVESNQGDARWNLCLPILKIKGQKAMKKLLILFIIVGSFFSCNKNVEIQQQKEIESDELSLRPREGYNLSQGKRKPVPYKIILQGTALGSNSIQLFWTGGGSLNKVYRKYWEYADTWIKIAETSSSTFTDNGTALPLYPSQPFTYKIVSGNSESNHVTVTTLLGEGTGASVLYLDFDGQLMNGTTWNFVNQYFEPSGLSIDQINFIRDSCQREANRVTNGKLIVTTDESVYSAANPFKRMRNINTVTYQYYQTLTGSLSGGAAYVNSFTWGDNTPALIHTSLLSYNTGYIIRANIHEAGHTFGLYHVTVSTAFPWANWMSGAGHYGFTGLFENPHSSGVYQINIINSKL